MARTAASIDVPAILAGLATAPEPDQTDGVTQAMIDATGELLARFGVRRWTMDDVADLAGVGRATVYRRFPNREELVRATLARDITRFFAAVAGAVALAEGVEEKVVDGFLVGMAMARESVVPALFESDRTAAFSLFGAAPVLGLGRTALADQYESVTGRRLHGPARAEVELVAEVLVRLAMSFVLIPESVIDFAHPERARRALRRVVGPLLAPGAP